MADKQLLVDDDFCNAMADYYAKQGEQLDKVISQCVSILQGIKDKSITSGDASNALGPTLHMLVKLMTKLEIYLPLLTFVTNFLTKVDSADKYLL